MKTPIERFQAKYLIADNGCWLWQAAKDQKGYGMFYINGKVRKANRASWMLYKGDIPDGLLVCHICDNPSCVNPEHLFLGSYTDNNRDAVAKARNRPLPGGANGRAVLSDEDILTIRQLATTHTNTYIATLYPVTRQQISDIVNRKKWRHI